MNSYDRFKSKRRKKILLTVLAVIVVVAIMASMFIFVYNKKTETERAYAELLNLVAEENYSLAYEKANSIIGSNYEDTTAILYLCSSRMLYEQGDILGAYEEIDKVEFRYITGEQLSKIEEYKEMLKMECETTLEEDGSSEISEKEESRIERETQKIKTEVKTAEEEFAYTDAEEMKEESEQTNNNKRAERENENENENS